MTLRPLRLVPSYREKIWGATALEPWFRPTTKKIGEVWFAFDENSTDDGRRLADLIREFGPALLGTGCTSKRFPILVKFIFTSERLSIQVHPDDAHAAAWEGTHGKAEMWHVLRAEPGAMIALGFREPITRARLREVSLSGVIESLARWFPARAGDTFMSPPGTVHAIGAGVALCEIQQNCDITYRLYDYGRPRELHLEKAVAVSNLNPHPGPIASRSIAGGRRLLASCEHFAAESMEIDGRIKYCPAPEHIDVLISVEGAGKMDGRRFAPGEVWLVPASAAPFEITTDGPVRFLRTYVPPRG